MRHIHTPTRFLLPGAALLLALGCAPITPLPGQNIPIPSPPSSGGTPSMPSPMPPQLPGGGQPSPPSPPSSQQGPQGQQSPQSGQQGGQQSPQSGQQSGQQGEQGDQGQQGQNAELPGGVPDPLASDSGDPAQQEDPELSWEKTESGGAASESEWETSNETPGGGGGASGQSGEQGELAGGASGAAGAEGEEAQAGAPGGGGSTEDELEGALQDFDGEILAERDVLRSSGGPSSSVPLPESPDGGPGGDAEADGSRQAGGPVAGRSMPDVPAPPTRSSEVPDDIPDAKDDDIIARQLREAAMQEQDPELREKLWDEYRRYKRG